MNIADIQERGKTLADRVPPHALTVAILILATTAAFGLGILAGKDMEKGAGKGFWIEERGLEALGKPAQSAPLPKATKPETGTPGVGYVASKSGTKYYLPSCSGVKRIKEENKVWFATVDDAKAAGLTPASNCPGL